MEGDITVLITVGDADAFDLFEPAKATAEAFTKVGIATTFVQTHGGHTTNGEAQIANAIRFVGEHLDAAK